MTIDDLIEYLEDYREEIGGDAEVRFMSQQSWPMEYGICGLASQAEMDEQIEDARWRANKPSGICWRLGR